IIGHECGDHPTLTTARRDIKARAALLVFQVIQYSSNGLFLVLAKVQAIARKRQPLQPPTALGTLEALMMWPATWSGAPGG
ncbi:MAG: hypothetical protein M3255_10020, partial [Pseudomonadota bacterium]|nr:hypothetical protein [Pseudomonadota bacterium]